MYVDLKEEKSFFFFLKKQAISLIFKAYNWFTMDLVALLWLNIKTHKGKNSYLKITTITINVGSGDQK